MRSMVEGSFSGREDPPPLFERFPFPANAGEESHFDMVIAGPNRVRASPSTENPHFS